MSQFHRALMKYFPIDDRGATAIEYGLIAALVGLAVAAALTTLGTDLAALFNGIATKLTTYTPK